MAGTADQDIVLNGTLPAEFKIVIVPFYGTATGQEIGAVVNVDQDTSAAPISIPLELVVGEGPPLISLTVIYQMGCVLSSIPGISIPADNRDINLYFVKTGCVNFLTASEPLNSLAACCDIHAA